MDINKELQTIMLLRNNSPLKEFLDLSPNQMQYLLYEPFSKHSPVQMHEEIQAGILDQLWLFRIAEAFLNLVKREKEIKLTPRAALPKTMLVELYDKKFLLDELIESGVTKLSKQEDCITIMSTRYTLELAKLIKKRNNKLSLTKSGNSLLESSMRTQLFKAFFEAFTTKFLWAFNDGFENDRVGQFGWAFTILMLNKFGSEPRSASVYASKYLEAFPSLLDLFQSKYETPQRQFYHCYELRSFQRFSDWFGFTDLRPGLFQTRSEANIKVKMDLLKAVFKCEE